MLKARGVLVGTLGVTLMLILGACGEKAAGPKLDPADIEANNRGVGLMGYFDYEGARQTFEALAREHPDWDEVQVNLAIATLNRQQAGDEATALTIVNTVLARSPGHLRAHYVAGLLSLNAGDSTEALQHFAKVADADPEDAYAAYYVALCKAQTGDGEAALASYRRAISLDPYLRSAYYGAFQALQRLGERAEARAMLEQFQRLEGNPQARLAEFKYTRMGEKGAAQVVNLEPAAPITRPEGVLFAGPEDLSGLPKLKSVNETGMTLADLDEDGRLDLFLPSTAQGSLLAFGNGQGGFAGQASHPLSGIEAVRTALWGDFDNDGLTDAYLLRDGPNQLWRQQAIGEWVEVTESAAAGNGARQSVDGLLLDADHDGDLDILVVNGDGPVELLNNNLDGTFRSLAASQGLADENRAARGVLAADLDNDRDTDLVFLYAEPPNRIFLNDRLWDYREVTEPATFLARSLLAAVAGDLNADGELELYAVDADGSVLRWRRDSAPDAWAMTELAGPGSAGQDGRAQLALADLDGDGAQEMIYSIQAGWQAAAVDGDRLSLLDGASVAAPMHWTLANMSLPGGPALLGAVADAAPRIWRPGPGRYPFMGLMLTGLEEAADSMRSNASGIGTRVAVRVDSRWSAYSTLRSNSGPGQSLQPLFVGVAGRPAADFVALTWSDGVFQTELKLATGEMHSLKETQRQLSSCPVLFAWDGEGYAFVSDLLGVGGLGFNTGFGEYAEPRPWEFFQLPQGLVAEREGRVELKIAEPMEEVAYIDSAQLRAYSLPRGWSMVLDERMGLAAPLPSGRPVFYMDEWLPVAANNERLDDVLAKIVAKDDRAAPVGPLDRRFIGRLENEHVLELAFARPLAAGDGTPWLVADGWVEYPYSQTGFAAWQAGAAFNAPSLEAGNEAGDWTPVVAGFGYPAGMPRRMALPLDRLPADTTRLRLRTNLEVYWDRLAVVFAKDPPGGLVTEALPLLSARMEEVGFPRRTNGPQRRPHYDYEQRVPLWDTRHPRGHYTAFGEATELVAQTDDALAIIGPGEALTLSFAAPADAQAVLVLETRGWAKDMDLYTADAGTVGPLPARGVDSGRREDLHERFNTRFEAGF